MVKTYDSWEQVAFLNTARDNDQYRQLAQWRQLTDYNVARHIIGGSEKTPMNYLVLLIKDAIFNSRPQELGEIHSCFEFVLTVAEICAHLPLTIDTLLSQHDMRIPPNCDEEDGNAIQAKRIEAMARSIGLCDVKIVFNCS